MRPVTDLQRKIAPFDVVSEFEPAGDQPAAIAELARRIAGVSPKMLTQTLRNLERDGLVRRTVLPATPPQVPSTPTSLPIFSGE